MTLKQGMQLVENQLTYARNGIKKYRGGTLVGLKAVVNYKGIKPLVCIPKELSKKLNCIWQQGTEEENFLVSSLKGDLTKAVDGAVVPITLYYSISEIIGLTETRGVIEKEYQIVITGASISTEIDFSEQQKIWDEFKSQKAAVTPPATE